MPPHQEQAYANLPPRFQDSAASNVPNRPPPPGRIEDMASPVNPYNQQGSSGYNTNPDDVVPVNHPGAGESSREVIAKLRKEFMERPPEEPVLQRPKHNKYLSPEKRYSPPKVSQ